MYPQHITVTENVVVCEENPTFINKGESFSLVKDSGCEIVYGNDKKKLSFDDLTFIDWKENNLIEGE